jgi:hypothetical protein
MRSTKKQLEPATATEKANAERAARNPAAAIADSSIPGGDRPGHGRSEKLQSAINSYQARTSMSPVIEEQYKDLIRGYDTAQKLLR